MDAFGEEDDEPAPPRKKAKAKAKAEEDPEAEPGPDGTGIKTIEDSVALALGFDPSDIGAL
eukprot:5595124-Pyramimonas_sp.AAC.1